jgi:hypothetical protein
MITQKSLIEQTLYRPSDNLGMMTLKNAGWGTTGLLFGILINNIIVALSNSLKIKYLIVQNIMQLFLCSLTLATLHTYYHYFGWSWQNITPGLFFVSFFFGVQFKIMLNIQSSYILDDITKEIDLKNPIDLENTINLVKTLNQSLSTEIEKVKP